MRLRTFASNRKLKAENESKSKKELCIWTRKLKAETTLARAIQWRWLITLLKSNGGVVAHLFLKSQCSQSSPSERFKITWYWFDFPFTTQFHEYQRQLDKHWWWWIWDTNVYNVSANLYLTKLLALNAASGIRIISLSWRIYIYDSIISTAKCNPFLFPLLSFVLLLKLNEIYWGKFTFCFYCLSPFYSLCSCIFLFIAIGSSFRAVYNVRFMIVFPLHHDSDVEEFYHIWDI